MAKYRPYDYSQRVMIPVSLEDQLIPGILEFAIYTLVEDGWAYRCLTTDTTTM